MKNGYVSAVLGGDGIALNKTGAGTVTLTGANSYTGATNVSEGTLVLQGADRVSTLSALDLSGGNLSTDGSQTVKSLTLSANSTLDLNNAGYLTFSDAMAAFDTTYGGLATLAVSNYSNGASPYALRFLSDWTSNGTFITFGGNTTINGSAAQMSFDGSYTNLGLAAVPEPSTVVGALALVALIGFRERKFIAGVWAKVA